MNKDFEEDRKYDYIDLVIVINDICFEFCTFTNEFWFKKRAKRLALQFIEQMEKITNDIKVANFTMANIVTTLYFKYSQEPYNSNFDEDYQNAFFWLEKLIYWYYSFLAIKDTNKEVVDAVKDAIEKQFEESLTYEQKPL